MLSWREMFNSAPIGEMNLTQWGHHGNTKINRSMSWYFSLISEEHSSPSNFVIITARYVLLSIFYFKTWSYWVGFVSADHSDVWGVSPPSSFRVYSMPIVDYHVGSFLANHYRWRVDVTIGDLRHNAGVNHP